MAPQVSLDRHLYLEMAGELRSPDHRKRGT
jgi:hypothetical protein